MVIGECLNICSEFEGAKSIISLENCLIGWDNSYFNISIFFFKNFGGPWPPSALTWALPLLPNNAQCIMH